MKYICPLCHSNCFILDVVDFNKSCEESKGKFLELSGIPIYYVTCEACGFTYTPDIYKWTKNEFEKNIYNENYIDVDPDYREMRPKTNALNLIKMFPNYKKINHLDYGGGNGILSKILREYNWMSTSYDPFVDKDVQTEDLGKFNLITVYEVFEHVSDINNLMKIITSLLTDDGIVMFSTLVSDGNIIKNQRLTWWYASPRNGHISLFTMRSLHNIAIKFHLRMGSLNAGLHILLPQKDPDWFPYIKKINI